VDKSSSEPRIVYRYDAEEYPEDRIMRSRGDHMPMLTEIEKLVEERVRAALPDGQRIRATSLYTWAHAEKAKQLWHGTRGKHLYELEVDVSDIQFEGDLDYFSAAGDAIANGRDPAEAISAYCSGHTISTRVEVLVSQARVRRKLFDASENPGLRSRLRP
jgi:hypothetical protein